MVLMVFIKYYVTCVILSNYRMPCQPNVRKDKLIVDMEEKRITVESLNKDLVIAKYKIFDWEVVEEHNGFFFSKLKFSRDEQTPYYSELKKLETQYGEIKTVPFIAIFIPSLLAIITITALLILFIANRDIAKAYWFIFIIPAGLCLIVAMAMTFLKLKIFDQTVKELPEKNKEYIQKVKELKK